MHRFYLPPTECRGDVLTLAGEEAHHALRVLRVHEGERVTVLDGAGTVIGGDVAGCSRHAVNIRVRERTTAAPPPCAISLIQAVPKGKLMESIVQKATELGAARIVPILSERAIVHLDADGAEAKAEKWRHVAVEAVKQCGSPWLPRVDTPLTTREFIGRGEGFDLAVVACLEPGSRHPRAWFDQFRRDHGHEPRSIAVWVGPEGDFTPAEYAAIQQTGAQPITLGPLVLRVETAATWCLSVVNYELQAAPAA